MKGKKSKHLVTTILAYLIMLIVIALLFIFLKSLVTHGTIEKKTTTTTTTTTTVTYSVNVIKPEETSKRGIKTQTTSGTTKQEIQTSYIITSESTAQNDMYSNTTTTTFSLQKYDVYTYTYEKADSKKGSTGNYIVTVYKNGKSFEAEDGYDNILFSGAGCTSSANLLSSGNSNKFTISEGKASAFKSKTVNNLYIVVKNTCYIVYKK